MIKYILPIFIIGIISVGIIKKVGVYDSFVVGAKESLKLILNIFPYIISIMILLELFSISGLSDILEKWLESVFKALGIPKELTSLIVVRPLSGSGSMAVLEDIIKKYGVDSYIARCGAIIVGASETVFYVAVVYFSTTKVKKLRYGIPVALFASFVGVVVSCLIARFL